MTRSPSLACAIACVVACGPPHPRAIPNLPPPFPTGPLPIDAGVAAVALADPADAAFAIEPSPGCTPSEASAREHELDAIDDAIRGSNADPAVVLAQIHAVIAKPCLAYVAPALALPAATTVDDLRIAWREDGLQDALTRALAGFKLGRGLRTMVIPPDIMPALDDAKKRALAPMLCPNQDASCARSASYVLRANEAFAAHADSADRTVPVTACDGERRFEDDQVWPRTLEQFVSCAASQAPRARRYATVALRAIDRGWLVLRGRRGHYDWADEVRAYDLATGAAYVARHTGVIIQTATTPAHGDDAFVGRVAPDQLREVAFVLLTRAAIGELRTRDAIAVVPASIPIALGTGQPPDPTLWPQVTWASDAQTSIAWTFADGATRASGTFTWPSAADWVDGYVSDLVKIAEAGFVRDCAPAKLPPRGVIYGPAGAVSAVDASDAEQRATDAALDKLLDGVRGQACRGAK